MKKILLLIVIVFLTSCAATTGSYTYDNPSIEYAKLHHKYKQRQHKKPVNNYVNTKRKER